MKIKNLMLVMAAAGALTACSSSDDATEGNGGNNGGNNGNNGGVSEVFKGFTGTQVYVGVEGLGLQNIGVTSTRAWEDPDASIDYGYANAFKYDKAAATYKVYVDPRSGYPADAVVEVAGEEIFTDFPNHKDNKTGGILGTVTTPYVMSSDGTGVAPFIKTTATVESVKAALDAKYTKGNKIGTYADECKDNKNGEEYIIWYLAAQENGSYVVEGILTDRNNIKAVNELNRDENRAEIALHGQSYTDFTTNYADGNIKAIDPTLRYDIAQQEHTTWGEIKTSLHIQESKDVVVTLPIENCYTLDAVTTENGVDTTRTVKVFGQLYYGSSKTGAQTNVEVKVERKGDNLVITVPAIAQDLLAAAARKYNDGITVEVHTFYKLTADDVVAAAGKEVKGTDLKEVIWNKLKNATITYAGERKGRKYSAYYTPDTKDANGNITEYGGDFEDTTKK